MNAIDSLKEKKKKHLFLMLLSGLNSECCGLGGVVSLISFFSPLDCLVQNGEEKEAGRRNK